MNDDRYNDDSTADLLDSIEACLARVKERIDVHGSAESAERALAEVRRRLSDEEAERLRSELNTRIGLAEARAEFYESNIRWRDGEINRLYRALADALTEAAANARPIRPPGLYRDTDGAVGTIGPPSASFGKILQVFYVDRDDQHVPFGERMLEARTLTTDEAQRLARIEPATKWGGFRL